MGKIICCHFCLSPVTMSKTGVHLSGRNGREETRKSSKMKISLLQVLTSLGSPTR